MIGGGVTSHFRGYTLQENHYNAMLNSRLGPLKPSTIIIKRTLLSILGPTYQWNKNFDERFH